SRHSSLVFTIPSSVPASPPPLDSLTLHDALPICPATGLPPGWSPIRRRSSTTTAGCTCWPGRPTAGCCTPGRPPRAPTPTGPSRSEEHTSELQSRFDLVCRLLLEKKKRAAMEVID